MIYVDVDGFNVPIGLGIWGTGYSESNMIKWASAMESLFQFNRDFEPEFVNYNTTKIPFDARWVGFHHGPVARFSTDILLAWIYLHSRLA
jgi:amidase